MGVRAAKPTARAVAYVKRMAESQMTSTVTIVRPTTPTFDATTGKITAHTGSSVYTGKARVYTASGPSLSLVGDEVTAYWNTIVSIPQDAGTPHRDDLVTINTSDDPALVGRVFRIVDVTAGGIGTPTRQLQCQGIEPNPFAS